jgi:hypothetical protein
MKKLVVISQSELDEFHKEISEVGLSIEDFSYTETDLTDWGPFVEYLHGEIAITRKSTNKQRTYNSGTGGHWLADFTKDLRGGYYN